MFGLTPSDQSTSHSNYGSKKKSLQTANIKSETEKIVRLVEIKHNDIGEGEQPQQQFRGWTHHHTPCRTTQPGQKPATSRGRGVPAKSSRQITVTWWCKQWVSRAGWWRRNETKCRGGQSGGGPKWVIWRRKWKTIKNRCHLMETRETPNHSQLPHDRVFYDAETHQRHLHVKP